MSYRVELSARAKRELDATSQWWSDNRSHAEAAKWYDGFLAALYSLESHPHRCSLARENESFPAEEIRAMSYGLGPRPTHRALFQVLDDCVYVLTIRHLHRDDASTDDLT